MAAPLKVLIVDDSAFMRQVIGAALAEDSRFEVVGSAPDPLIAREKIKSLLPDIITLDIEMPRMDGLEFLRRLMSLRPMRVLMVSSLTARNAEATLAALRLGAIDCLEKPAERGEDEIRRFMADLREKLAAVAAARMVALGSRQAPPLPCERRAGGFGVKLIAIGASTGGVEALDHLLHALPAGLPPILIVQHMPAKFTTTFARRLDQTCAFDVLEASDGLALAAGRAVIAPGGRHLEVLGGAHGMVCRVSDGPPVSGHAPSVDVLFHSAARVVGAAAIGVILTGMGRDGARGLLALREGGAQTIGQDEATSLVYGMPRAAAELGAVGRQLPLERIAGAILEGLDAGFAAAHAAKARDEIQP